MEIEIFTLADFAQDNNSKLTIVGTFDSIHAKEFPTQHPACSIACRLRFAAKEAVMKALGTGWNEKVSWLDIEIVNSETGSPAINLSGGAKKLAKELKVNNICLSLAHEKGYALAFVILESNRKHNF